MAEVIGGVVVDIRAPSTNLKADFDKAKEITRKLADDLNKILAAGPGGGAAASMFQGLGKAAQVAQGQVTEATLNASEALTFQIELVRQLKKDLAELNTMSKATPVAVAQAGGVVSSRSGSRNRGKSESQISREEARLIKEAELAERQLAEVEQLRISQLAELEAAINPLILSQRAHSLAIKDALIAYSSAEIGLDVLEERIRTADAALRKAAASTKEVSFGQTGTQKGIGATVGIGTENKSAKESFNILTDAIREQEAATKMLEAAEVSRIAALDRLQNEANSLLVAQDSVSIGFRNHAIALERANTLLEAGRIGFNEYRDLVKLADQELRNSSETIGRFTSDMTAMQRIIGEGLSFKDVGGGLNEASDSAKTFAQEVKAIQKAAADSVAELARIEELAFQGQDFNTKSLASVDAVRNTSLDIRSILDEKEAEALETIAAMQRVAAESKQTSAILMQNSNQVEGVIETQTLSVRELAKAYASIPQTSTQANINNIIGVSNQSAFKDAEQSAKVFERAIVDIVDALDDARSQIELIKSESASLEGVLKSTKAQQRTRESKLQVSGIVGEEGVGIFNEAENLVQNAEAAQEYSESLAELAARKEALMRIIDPAFGAQERFNAAIEEAKILLDGSAQGQQNYNTALAIADLRLKAANEQRERFQKGMGSLTAASKLSGFQLTNLSFQLNDVIQGFALGQPPMQIFAQQGFQIAQILSQSQGGFGAGLRGVLALLTPTRIAIGVTAGAVAGAALTWLNYANNVKEAQTALSGVSGGSGITIGALKNLAAETSKDANLSVSATEKLILAYSKLGVRGGDNLKELAAITQDFAKTTGISFTEAQNQLGKIGREGAGQAALSFAKDFGDLIDDSTARNIDRIEELNGQYAATQELLKVLRTQLIEVEDASTGVGNAARRAGNFIKDLFRVRGTTAEEQLEIRKNAILEVNDLRNQAGKPISFDLVITKSGDIAFLSKTREELEKLVKVQKDAAAAARDHAESQDKLSKALDLVKGSQVSGDLGEILKLRQQQSVLTKGLVASAGGGTKEEQESLIEAFLRTKFALDSLENARKNGLDAQARVLRLSQLELEELKALNPIRRAQIAQEREQLLIVGESLTPLEARTRIINAYRKEIEAVLGPVREQTRSTELQIRLQEQHNESLTNGTATLKDAQRQMDINNELAEIALLKSAMGTSKTEAEKKALQELVNIIEKRINAQVRLNAVQDQGVAIEFITQTGIDARDSIRSMEAQASAIGLTRREAIELLRTEELLQQLADRLVVSTDDLVAAGGKEVDMLRAQAAAIAAAEDALAQLQIEYRLAEDAADSFGQTAFNALDRLLVQLDDWRDVVGDILKQLASDSLQAFLLGQGPLAGVLGTAPTDGSQTGGALGGVLSDVFGLRKKRDERDAAASDVGATARDILTGGTFGNPIPVWIVNDNGKFGQIGGDIFGLGKNKSSGEDAASEALDELSRATRDAAGSLQGDLTSATVDAALQTIVGTTAKTTEATTTQTVVASMLALQQSATLAAAALAALAATETGGKTAGGLTQIIGAAASGGEGGGEGGGGSGLLGRLFGGGSSGGGFAGGIAGFAGGLLQSFIASRITQRVRVVNAVEVKGLSELLSGANDNRKFFSNPENLPNFFSLTSAVPPDMIQKTETTLSNVFITDAASPYFAKMKNAVKDGTDLIRIALLAMAGTQVGGAFGGIIGSVLGAVFHEGSGSTLKRSVPASTFAGAPRLHDGLFADEFPAILQKGERVIPRNQVRREAVFSELLSRSINFDQLNAGTGTTINAPININIPQGYNPRDFREGAGKLSARLSRRLVEQQRRHG